jgi:hypothetical protein
LALNNLRDALNKPEACPTVTKMRETQTLETLELLYRQGVIDALDLEFGRLMGGLARDHSRELLLGCAMVSHGVSAVLPAP